MQPSPDPITVRTTRLNSELTKTFPKSKILSRDGVLDALQVLYDECSSEQLKRTDPNVAAFANKYDGAFRDLKTIRVNLADFEIVKLIGSGQFGRVDVVKEIQTGDVYALKSMRKFDGAIKKLSYEEERDILASSKSVWLTKLQYSFQDCASLYLVMDYNPGGDLAGLLRREGGYLPEHAAVFYVAEVILALEVLHSMGYVHRDIKPDNVLIDRCGHLKLADFGSASKLNDNGLVSHGPPVGSPEYIAPEVLMSMNNTQKSKTYGTSCDFWGLGVVAYELPIGHTPFQGANVSATYAKITQHVKYLKFPPDHGLSADYISMIKGLICDRENRLGADRLKTHPIFQEIEFDQVRDMGPPFVPKLTSNTDSSYFKDVANCNKKKSPCLERRRPHFSGRNLPFIGFSYTPQPIEVGHLKAKEVVPEDMAEISKKELEKLKLQLAKSEEWDEEKETLVLENMARAKTIKILEDHRNELEKQLAKSMSECNGLKNMMKLEHEDRKATEEQAQLKIKKWRQELARNEEIKIMALQSEIDNQKQKIGELNNTVELLQGRLSECQSQMNEHRNSSEAQQKSSRRSQMEFHHLYQKTDSDRLAEIKRLNNNLSVQIEGNTMLQNEILTMKNEILRKTAQIDSLQEELDAKTLRLGQLDQKFSNMDQHVSELSIKIDASNKEKEDINRQLSEIASLKTDISEKQREIDKLRQTNSEHLIQLKELAGLRTQVKEGKSQIDSLKDDLKRTKEHEELLQKKLEEIHHSSEDLKEKTLQCYRLERQVSQHKIDLKIAERNLNYAEEEAKELKAKLETIQKDFDDHKKMHQMAISELSDINNDMAQSMLKMKNKIIAADQEMTTVKGQLVNSTSEIEQLNKRLTEADLDKRKLIDQLKDLKLANDELLSSIAIQLDKTKKTDWKVTQLSTENENLKADIERLKQGLIILERQEIESEEFINTLNKVHTDKLKENEATMNALRQELELSRKDINTIKSERLALEQQIQKLLDIQKSLESEVDSYQNQFIQYKNLTSETMEKLTKCEERLLTVEGEVEESRRLVDKLTESNEHYIEEIAKKTRTIQNLKEAKYQLAMHVNDYSRKIEDLEKRLANLEEEYNEKISFFQDRQHKAEEKDKQQLKLIDYLQSQMQNQSHKRTLKDMFFGKHKENQPPLSLAKNYKDLEMELMQEKEKNQILKRQLATLGGKREVLKEEKKNGQSAPKLQHRLSKRTNMKLRMCSHCNTNLHPPNYMYSCSECDFHIHTQCLSKATSCCGKKPMPLTATPKTVLKESVLEGWLKVPNTFTKDWERCYVRLGRTFVDIYKHRPIDEEHRLKSFCINMPDSRTTVCLNPLASEVVVPLSDAELENVLKVTMTARIDMWAHENCTLLALNVEDRGLWLDAFYKVLNHDLELRTDKIVALTEDDVFTEIVEIAPDTHLLASHKGLYARHNDRLFRIDEIGSVKQITVFHPAKLVLMLAAPDYKLVACELDRLITIAHGGVSFQIDSGLKSIDLQKKANFLKIGVSDNINESRLAVANARHLLIVKYSSSEFKVERVLDTVCPTKCLLFTRNSLIAGADKFYEIDLRNFQIEEFLDLSSALFQNLYSDVNAIVGITQISQGEYLLTFKKFSAFVDEFGSALKLPEISHETEPLVVMFLQENLYIVESEGITLMKLKPSSANPTRIDISSFRLLGADSSGLYLSHQLHVRHLNADKFVRDLSSSESSDFSFTSSMVQSLDNSLISTSSPPNEKIKFSD